VRAKRDRREENPGVAGLVSWAPTRLQRLADSEVYRKRNSNTWISRVNEISSTRFAILTGQMHCHACRAPTRVSALLVPGLPDGEEDDRMDPKDAARLQYITLLNPEALAAWQAQAPWVRMMRSATAQTSYWANSCENCGVLQGDWYTAEPDAPFFPTSQVGIDALHCIWVDQPIRAVADASQSTWMVQLVAR
jgi:hypothetical protein